MNTLKLMAVASAILVMVSCKKEQAETVIVDNTENVSGTVKEVVANAVTSTFKIDGMTCQIGCAAKIEKSLSKMEGVSAAKVNFETKTATVSYDADKVTTKLLAKRVASNGDQYKADFTKKM